METQRGREHRRESRKHTKEKMRRQKGARGFVHYHSNRRAGTGMENQASWSRVPSPRSHLKTLSFLSLPLSLWVWLSDAKDCKEYCNLSQGYKWAISTGLISFTISVPTSNQNTVTHHYLRNQREQGSFPSSTLFYSLLCLFVVLILNFLSFSS